MQLSTRIANLKSSPTLALNTKAKKLAQSGTKVYNFAVGEPDFDAPPLVIDTTIAALKAGKTKYGTAGGGQPLRQAIANKLKRDNDLSYTAKEIVAGIGAKEILFHTFMAMLNEGDEVIIPTPYWVSYTSQIEACGARSIEVPMPPEHTGPRLTPQMLTPFINRHTKALVLNSPNNPAGYVFKEPELKDLASFLKRHDFWIISDEIYEYMAFDQPHLSLLQIEPALRDRFILINGLSKGFAMTGFRVGYAAGPENIMKLVGALQSHSSTCLPAFIEDAATAALNAGKPLMADGIKELRQRRDLAVAELEKIAGLSFIPPEGAFYVYIDIRDFLNRSTRYSNLNSLAFSEDLLARFHVAMVPGEAFGTKGFLRLSYAVNTKDLIDGIAKLKLALKELN